MLARVAAAGLLKKLPEGVLRRVQLMFDAHGWTSSSGLTRLVFRCPDLVGSFNDPLFGQEPAVFLGQDQIKALTLVSKLGGEQFSLNSLMYRSMVCEELTEGSRAALKVGGAQHAELLRDLLAMWCGH